uniref:Uncharacterized protein n=1 Tax=Daphnia galeata TaxID=27404 RepID=A0A8J2WID4_9CRUS|nr:unnamed protein product [Daphnia galeata]
MFNEEWYSKIFSRPKKDENLAELENQGRGSVFKYRKGGYSTVKDLQEDMGFSDSESHLMEKDSPNEWLQITEQALEDNLETPPPKSEKTSLFEYPAKSHKQLQEELEEVTQRYRDLTIKFDENNDELDSYFARERTMPQQKTPPSTRKEEECLIKELRLP